MDILLKTLQVLLALSLLVFVHELGHFFFARLFKIRVEKFYLFFDWGFSLLKFKPKNSDTEYGIGWLPLGGYCKIAGMIDESLDTDTIQKPPQPWEFRSKPAWQRLLVMFGGVLFNFIFAIIMYICILFFWGENYISNKDASIYTTDIAYEMGFRNGDRILEIGDAVPEDFSSLSADILHEQAQSAKVLREGDTVTLNFDAGKYIPRIIESKSPVFWLAVPFVIDSLPSGSINEGILSPGDSVVAVDGQRMTYLQDVKQYLASNRKDSVDITVIRAGHEITLKTCVDTNRMVQAITRMPKTTYKDYTLASAIPAGIKLTFSTIDSYLKELKLIFTPQTKAYKGVGSFITIGSIFPASWDWLRFWSITALLSIMLGVVNLLPIPALDGGHILFTLFEIITGKKPSDKFLTAAQVFGMILLLALMALAFSNDLRNFIF